VPAGGGRDARRIEHLRKSGQDPASTELFGAQAVSKTDVRVNLLGDVDELVSAIGLARSRMDHGGAELVLRRVQTVVLALGALIGDPDSRQHVAVTAADVQEVSDETKRLAEALPPLRKFIIPGGNEGAAALHLARSICRRAERTALALHSGRALPEAALELLNGLSTFLFYLARWQTHAAGERDDIWSDPKPLRPGELDIERQ